MSRVWGRRYFVYVLWGQSARRIYVGVSESPTQRLNQHNEGRKGWTSRYRPWVLVHSERSENFREARKREIELESQKSGKAFFLRTGLDPERFSRAG
jgi:putative endonuclease